MNKKRIILVIYMIICGVLLVVLTGCGNKTSEKSNNKVQNSVEENNEKNKTLENESNTENQNTNHTENKNTDNDNTKTNENSKSNLKLDARYIYQDSNVAIQIELYKDNTMYYSYVPKKQRTSEYYEGTFSIDGNKLIMNLTADGENMGTEVIKNGNKLTCTILSNTEFKDENGRTIKFSIDYPKGLRPNER